MPLMRFEMLGSAPLCFSSVFCQEQVCTCWTHHTDSINNCPHSTLFHSITAPTEALGGPLAPASQCWLTQRTLHSALICVIKNEPARVSSLFWWIIICGWPKIVILLTKISSVHHIVSIECGRLVEAIWHPSFFKSVPYMLADLIGLERMKGSGSVAWKCPKFGFWMKLFWVVYFCCSKC